MQMQCNAGLKSRMNFFY